MHTINFNAIELNLQIAHSLTQHLLSTCHEHNNAKVIRDTDMNRFFSWKLLLTLCKHCWFFYIDTLSIHINGKQNKGSKLCTRHQCPGPKQREVSKERSCPSNEYNKSGQSSPGYKVIHYMSLIYPSQAKISDTPRIRWTHKQDI